MPPALETPGPTGRDTALADAAGVFVVALIPRLLHLRQIAENDPFFALPSVDGRVYHEWAQRIAAGDWVGEGVLTLGPLYPYLMGALYSLTGPDLLLLKTLQAILGAVTAALAYLLARAVFDRRAGWVAGLLTAAYGMLVFYGGTVMVVNIQVPLVLATVLLAVRAWARPTIGRWLAVGCVLGLSTLARQTVLLYAPLLAAWIWIGAAEASRAERTRWVAALAAGVLLLVAPFTLRNVVTAGDWVLVSAAAGPNLYMGNREGADGRWQPPPIGGRRIDDPLAMRAAFAGVAEQRLGRSLKTSEVSSYWTSEAIARIREDPLGWIRLEARKVLLFVNAGEMWNNRSFAVSRQFSWVLGLPLAGFGLVFPLAVVGLTASRMRWRTLMPLYAMLATYLTSALLFFVLSRYRMPAAAILIVFAGAGAVALFDAARARQTRTLALACALFVAATALTRIDLAGNDLHMAWYNLGNKYRSLQRFELAIESYERSLAANPHAIATRNNLALALEGAGRTEEAIAAWQTVLASALRNRDARRVERATRHLRQLGADAPGDASIPGR